MLNPGFPGPEGLYDPRFERDACGIGFVADRRGRASFEVLAKGVSALENLAHRGAVDADAESGDGAGVLTQIPSRLFVDDFPQADTAPFAVGMCFLPAAPEAREAAMTLVESAIAAQELPFWGWRVVPTDPEALGEKARATVPDIRQALVGRPDDLDEAPFERKLYLARKAIERDAERQSLKDLYICSLSGRTVVYKGLVSAHQLQAFYADLRDPRFTTATCLFHQRYSTNTFPSWPLAQPFRMLGHNGEINTVEGNRRWMTARESDLTGGPWSPGDQALLTPVVQKGGSDSCSLDNVLELLMASGRGLVHAVSMLMPEAYEHDRLVAKPVRAFYAYHAGLMEPWDGPAAVAFSDGHLIGARLDRNGLRPARYAVLKDGLVVLGSEAGMLDLDPSQVLEKGRLGPGETLAVDTRTGEIHHHADVQRLLAKQRPYGDWLDQQLTRVLRPEGEARQATVPPETGVLLAAQTAFGYSQEEIDRQVGPMAKDGKEAVGSMGDDTPLAVFSEKARPLYAYFRQRFAQVTNPPIDSLREKSAMSLATRLGARGALLTETPEHARQIEFASPILTDAELAWLRGQTEPAFASTTLDATWNPAEGERGLEVAIARLTAAAAAATRAGRPIVILSDRAIGPERAPVPMLLASAACHQHLVKEGLRPRTSLVLETGEPREEHHFACLIGYGADAINPYVALATAAALGSASLYQDAIEAGLRKIMAKMGIACVASYRGAQIFEAIGLASALVERAFEGTPARLGGVGFAELAERVAGWHRLAFPSGAPNGSGEPTDKLPDLGLFRFRVGGEYHQYNPHVFKGIQKVAKSGDTADFAEVANLVEARPVVAIRDCLSFKKAPAPVPLDEVEPASAIVKRFVACAMSLGALSPEAHACIATAMFRLGAKSNSGEGGEDPARFGTESNSTIKQVASGRFGVTPAYLVSGTELEIKMAQGAKPGEGGQIPAHKVTEEIARLRHATPGMSLISPPPHHDIYSIEDLAQLIFDLKQANPAARVGVKLVAEAGVGTIAAGVAKAHADTIHISGHDGGTGASPWGSIKNAGAPWELGLAETQQTLVKNRLRGRVSLRVDGGLKSGRDIVTAALLGADEYGFGTTLLIAAGCIMARQCHMNTCPVGVATQNPDLRAKFKGTPENVMNFLLGVAEDVRRVLSELGVRRLEEIVGRTDLLTVNPALEGPAAALKLSALLADPDPAGRHPRRRAQARNGEADRTLDVALLEAAKGAIATHGAYTAELPIRNTDRSVGIRLACEIARRYGDTGFKGRLELKFTGTAGQSFGAFLLDGLAFTLTGEANDYVGKGMAGGTLVVRPPLEAAYPPHESTIVGNTVLYGATGGRLFVAGRAGERFAVRNSGGTAVVEGVGDHGCEYMTGGVAVVLGRTGRNFAAGMTGGVAYVLDEDGQLDLRLNLGSAELVTPSEEELAELQALIELHARLTGSTKARALLDAWPEARRLFRKVRPAPVSEAAKAPAQAKLAS